MKKTIYISSLILIIFASVVLFWTSNTNAQTVGGQCATYHEDGTDPMNLIGNLNLDCGIDAWFWPNYGGVRNDGFSRSCTQTFNDYVAKTCPFGNQEPVIENGFCGVTNGAQATFSCNPAPSTINDHPVDINLKIRISGQSASIAIINPNPVPKTFWCSRATPQYNTATNSLYKTVTCGSTEYCATATESTISQCANDTFTSYKQTSCGSSPVTVINPYNIDSGGSFSCVSTQSSPLKIYKGGTTYSISLVDPTHSEATKFLIKTAQGIKALRKCLNPSAGVCANIY